MPTLKDLQYFQAMPLRMKMDLSRNRIREWINRYGEDGCYISFSGGKDSTVLLDLVRNYCGYKKVPAMFVERNSLLCGYNNYLGTNFTQDDMYWIYDKLGNAVNHELTLKFINSNYDLSLVKPKVTESEGNE